MEALLTMFLVTRSSIPRKYPNYTRQKKKLLAFSFANFKITRWSTGKQWGLLEYPTKVNYTVQKKFIPIFLKFKLNKRGVSFFEGVYLSCTLHNYIEGG